MPKLAPELSDAAVRRLKWSTVKSGPNKGRPCAKLHAVGGVGGLYLQCSPPVDRNAKTFARSWLLKTPVGADRPELGLGPYPEVTLSEARQRARELKALVREGIDPRVERRQRRSALLREQAKTVTFRELSARYVKTKSQNFKTAKQTQKLNSHLETYAYPYLGNMIVGDIERSHIVSMLQPIWETKNETAKRVRMTVERILDLGGVEGLRTGDNPARWAGNLQLTFPQPEKISPVQHLAAMPIEDLPVFMSELKKKKTMGARALRFSILTAARSGEIRGATWDEIDLAEKLWTVPADRMKNNRDHRVPLCADALAIIKSLRRDNDLVFPAPRGGQMSDMTLTKVMRNMGRTVTQHGFRATFRTWAQESTNFAEEVCELALAHVNSDATRAAYARSELVDKRRKLMNQWQAFCRSAG